MNKIGLGLFIFEVTFILADFSPYRGECNRFGKFDIHIKGKKVNLLLIFSLIAAYQRTISAEDPDCYTTNDVSEGFSAELFMFHS